MLNVSENVLHNGTNSHHKFVQSDSNYLHQQFAVHAGIASMCCWGNRIAKNSTETQSGHSSGDRQHEAIKQTACL